VIKHVVMWQLRESALGMDKPALAIELKKRLMSLVGKVPSIRGFEVGLNEIQSDGCRDLVLVSSFEDVAGLDAYIKHPAHQEVVAFVRQVVLERRAVDYEG
jgi:hypothetical protein